MFDLRYHVASLAAVFLALVVGILVGAAISNPELADQAEMVRQRDQILRLEDDLRTASTRLREQRAADAFVEAAYPAVIAGRLADKKIAVVFIGSVDEELAPAVRDALADAGAELLRLRALTVPLRSEALEATLASRRTLERYRGEERLSELGRELGNELVQGGETPLWDVLAGDLVEEQSGGAKGQADGVVVVRSAKPQREPTALFLGGLYAGLQGSVPIVGVEGSSTKPSAIGVFKRAGFSSVDSIDTAPGKVALAVLLEGARRGHYGMKESASRVLPRIDPVVPAGTDG